MTNYDRIKSMSIDEMLEFLNSVSRTGACASGYYVNCRDCPFMDTECNNLKSWLETEVSDDKL